MIVLIFLILISFSAMLLFYKNIKIEESLPYTFIGIILVVFFFGLIKLLKYGVFFVTLLSIISWLYIIYKFIKVKNKKEILKNVLSPGFIFFILSFIGLCIYHNGRLMTGWDEFSHWGDVVKAMYNINDFSTNPLSLSSAKTYLPGISIFQYFFQVLLGKFNEGYLYVSLQILTISMFLPFMKNIKWNNVFKYIFSILIILLSLIVYFKFYKEIYVDCFLGLMLGFNLASIYIMKNNYNKENIIKLSLSLSMMTLTKDMGIFFGMIIILIILIIRVVNNIKDKKFKIKDYIPVMILLLVTFGTYFIWQLNVKLSDITPGWSKPLDIKFILNSLLLRGNDYGVTVTRNYLFTLRHHQITTGYFENNCLTTLIIFSMFLYLIYLKSSKKNKINDCTVLVNSIIGFLGYALFMLIMYLWKFDEYEAVTLASWGRYIPTYLQAILSLIVMLTINEKSNRKTNINILLIFIWLVLAVTPSNIKSYLHRGTYETQLFRKPYDDAAEYVHDKLKDKKVKIYYISQASDGFDYWVFKFTARRNISYLNTGLGWSIGEKYYDKDIWTVDINGEEWMNGLVKDYDYLFIYKVDDKFINKYGYLFDNRNNIKRSTLYKIDKNNRKLIEVE